MRRRIARLDLANQARLWRKIYPLIVSSYRDMLRFLTRQPSVLAFVEALALLLAINWFDVATRHEVSLVFFMPCRFSLPSGFAIASSRLLSVD